MTLFQISEPGASLPKSACHGTVVGIDLGTTNSLVARIVDGNPQVIVGASAGALLPSAVQYGADGSVRVGAAALAAAGEHPRDVIVSAKRFMGRGPKDAESTRKLTPYEFATTDGPVVRFAVAGNRQVTPIEVSAEILRVLRERAEADAGGTLGGAVITVPAYFDDAQRQATKDAARLAGLDVLRLLNEPTAAALAYGLDKGSQGTFAVYDLGGGTFDVSILRLEDGVFQVRSTGGNAALGGDDLDRALAVAVLTEAGHEATTDQKLMRKALQEARRVKEALSDVESETFCVRADGVSIERSVTRDELRSWIRPVVEQTGAACRRALKDAELTAAELDGVILVGGATRAPAVREYVTSLFARAPLADIDPDQVVALGAAVQADVLVGGRTDDLLLLDVLPLSLGIETMGGVVEKVIVRNSTLPVRARQEFTTYADNQTGFDLHVVQGERDTADHCRSLARFQLRGLPALPAGMVKIELFFMVDADGLLTVTAREMGTGKETNVEVKPSYGLTDEDVERMLMESYDHAEDDMKTRALLGEQVEADRIVAALKGAMAADPDLVDAEVRVAVEKALADLDAARAGTDHRKIHESVAALDRASKPFAERRMNRAIEKAMRGRKVTDLEKGF